MKTISRYIMTLALLITAATGAWADDATYTVQFKANGKTVTRDVTLPHTFWCNVDNANGELDGIIMELNGWTGDGGVTYYCISTSTPQSTDPNKVKGGNTNSNHYITIDSKFDGTVTVSGRYSTNSGQATYSLDISFVVPAGTFSINDAKTEATMKMPQYDVTATYTIKRDISVDVTAQVGDGTQEQPRYRVKKDGNKFIPADMEMAAVPALFTVNDAIEQKDLTLNQDYYCRIYKLDEQTQQPEGDGVELADFDFAPGLYALKAFAMDDSDYAGETALSNTFKLFQGYEITVPAGEYITYYRDEPLKLDDADKESIELYTVSSVTATEAVLSDPFDAAPANTPLLVYNKNTEEAKTILLIPCNEPDLALTVADAFKGTLEATTIPASTTGADNYALNGYAFVWVKTAIEVGANKCWLHIASQPAAARAMTRSIVGGNGTTGIDAIENVTIDNEGWYDLQGRKLQSAPNRKGIYIHNGRKVVVH